MSGAISGTTFNGNIDLLPTRINNFDLRYELYGEKNNSATFSFFYKKLENAIELTKFKSDEDNINLFARYLRNQDIVVTVRRSRGKDIDAACGQLANKE